MILTRTWAAILAILATAGLAGMLLLAVANRADFSVADRAALRATTEAGLVALEAEIASSPVRHVVGLASPSPRSQLSPESSSSEAILGLVSDQAAHLRKRARSDLTLALLNGEGTVVATDGNAEAHLVEALSHPELLPSSAEEEVLLSLMIRDRLYVVGLSVAEPTGHRWFALAPLRTDAGSTFRRAIGDAMPAALVQGGRLVGEVLGPSGVAQEQLENLAIEHQLDTPEVGASQVFTMGGPQQRRLVALGRVPGLAGREPNPVLLVMVSPHVLDTTRPHLPTALARATSHSLPPEIFGLLIGLIVLSLGLVWFLPALEALQPLQRLREELDQVASGRSAQVTREHFSGAVGDVARSAVHAIDAVRHLNQESPLDDLEDESTIDPAVPLPPEESDPPTTRARPPQVPFGAPVPAVHGDAPSGLRTISVEHRGPPLPPRAPVQDVPTVFDRPRVRSGAAPATLPAGSFVRSRPAEAAAMPPLPMDFAPSGPAEAVDAPQLSADTSRESYYRDVYDEFLQVKLACGEPTDALTFDRFTAKLQRNEDDLRARRSDIKTVRFSVYVKDGRAALKAKVIKQ